MTHSEASGAVYYPTARGKTHQTDQHSSCTVYYPTAQKVDI